MPETALAEALRASAVDVLEKMFFVRSFEEFEDAGDGRELVAHLTFQGAPPGSLTLRVMDQAARSIATDFLGVDESELSEGEVGEVICELANMICGSVLSRVESNTTFRLATPRIIPPEDLWSLPDTAPSTAATYEVAISGGVMTISIQTDAPACPTTTQYVC